MPVKTATRPNTSARHRRSAASAASACNSGRLRLALLLALGNSALFTDWAVWPAGLAAQSVAATGSALTPEFSTTALPALLPVFIALAGLHAVCARSCIMAASACAWRPACRFATNYVSVYCMPWRSPPASWPTATVRASWPAGCWIRSMRSTVICSATWFRRSWRYWCRSCCSW
jgi:hypothetical protein